MTLIHDRWNENERLDLRRLFLESESCPSPFGFTEEGLCDFRGIRINVSLHAVLMENVDFTEAELVRGQLMAPFRHCKFVEFSCDGNLGESFDGCVFRKARLSNSVFYGSFINCDFSNANLTAVRGRHIRFEGCVFENVNLRKASFYDSSFINCRLVNCTIRSGSLAGSRFDGCEINGFDLSNTVMNRVKGLEQFR